MKIVFIVPAPDRHRSAIYRFGNKFYGRSNSMIGPLILGTILKRRGHEVEVYEELEEDIDLQSLLDASLVCISMFTTNAIRAYQLADYFRSRLKRVILGGIHASAMPMESLAHADQVVVGEAENVIIDVVEGVNTSPIVISTPVMNLDTLPHPDYDILKTKARAANILTSRGCMHSCKFCSSSHMFSPYRKRSTVNVIEELLSYKKLGFTHVNIQDDNFSANRERAKEILKAIIAEKLRFDEIFIFGRAEIAHDEELLHLMNQAQVKKILIGIESVNQESLDKINKKQNVHNIYHAGKMLQKHRIKLIASIILGIDGDTIDNMRSTSDFCRQINAYQLQPAILTPYPGTPLYREMDADGRIATRDWQLYDMMNVVFKPSNMNRLTLQMEFNKTVKDFYSIRRLAITLWLFGFEPFLRTVGLFLASHLVYYYCITCNALIYLGLKRNSGTAADRTGRNDAPTVINGPVISEKPHQQAETRAIEP